MLTVAQKILRDRRHSRPRYQYLSVHHDRGPQIDFLRRGLAIETSGRNADDGESMAIQNNRLAYQRRIAFETAPPKTVAQDHDRMRAGRTVFLGQERPPQSRLNSERVEVIPGNQRAKHDFAAFAIAETDLRRHVGERQP